MHTIELLRQLPGILPDVVARVPDGQLRTRSSDGKFAVVEHVWHLADLEEEGYLVRIERLLAEERPRLADFAGDAVAAERRYIDQSAMPAVERFVAARRRNEARLAALMPIEWQRSGIQEGVGEVTLARLSAMMIAHDLEHACEMMGLLSELGVAPPDALARFASAKRRVPGI